MEETDPAHINFEYEGRESSYNVFELFERLEGNYQNNSDYPIGLMFPYEGGVVDTSLFHFNRSRVLAEDYSDIFKLSYMPEFFDEKFRPFADLVHNDISLNNMCEVLEENLDGTDNEHYVMRLGVGPEHIDHSLRNLLESDERIINVNPIEMKKILGDKKSHLEFLDKQRFPVIPYMDAVNAVNKSRDYVEQKIGDTGEGWIVKNTKGYGGFHVEKADTFEGVRQILEDNAEDIQNGDEYILQPNIPHQYDYRIIMVGDKTVSAEKRRGLPDDFRTNLSQIRGRISERLLKGTFSDAFEPVAVDTRRNLEDSELEEDENALNREIQDLGNEILEGFEEFRHPDADVPNFFIAADIMIPDDQAIEGLPQEYRQRMRNWSNNEGNAAIIELNDGAGDIISYNAEAYRPSDMPILHEIGLLKQLAGLEPISPENIPRNYSTREWRRTHMIYSGTGPTEIVAKENIQKNIREDVQEILKGEGLSKKERDSVLQENFGFNFSKE